MDHHQQGALPAPLGQAAMRPAVSVASMWVGTFETVKDVGSTSPGSGVSLRARETPW